jgi:hypothetical protein
MGELEGHSQPEGEVPGEKEDAGSSPDDPADPAIPE